MVIAVLFTHFTNQENWLVENLAEFSELIKICHFRRSALLFAEITFQVLKANIPAPYSKQKQVSCQTFTKPGNCAPHTKSNDKTLAA
jgi:hypothetical protein